MRNVWSPYRFRLLLRALFHRRDVERELDDEIRFHIDQQVELNIAAGLAPDDARDAAERAFGNVEARKDDCRDHWAVAVLDRLARDTRHALRTLGKDATFTTGVVLLLALGIGANVATFSIVDGILLEPLPYREPDRLMIVTERIPEQDSIFRSVNALHFREWRSCSCFESIALSEYPQQLNLVGEGDPARVRSLRVTANAFSLLGVKARIGRVFVDGDAEPGRDTNVLISDRLWRNRFGADPAIVGRTIDLDARPSTIVGVLPPGFRYHALIGAPVDVFRPWSLVPPSWWRWTNNYSYQAVARLADGVTPRGALDELNAIQAGIARDHFEVDAASLSLEAVLTPLHEWVTGRSRDGLYLLLAAVGAALLVACLNIANLMLVRAAARAREAGIRSALGATRLAIFRSVFIESAVLAAGGCAAGIVLAWMAVEVFKRLAVTGLPRVEEVTLDGTVLLAAAALTVVSTLVFGLLPAYRQTRVDPERVLRTGGRAATDSHIGMRGRQALVSAEVGLSVTLLIVSGLLLVSFLRVDAVERGFDPTNVLTADVSLPNLRYGDNDARLRFWNALLDELRQAPGVLAAGLTSSLPLRGNNWGSTAIREGDDPPPEALPSVQYRFVSDGYLETIGIPLLSGRFLTRDDYPRNYAVVSTRTARLLWGEANPLGRRFHWHEPERLFEVVGVVPDVPSLDLESEPTPIVYRPLAATGDGTMVMYGGSIALRAAGGPAAAAATLRAAVAAIDPDLAVSNIRTMRAIESASVGSRRLQLILVGAFGGASLLIAALGIYSVLAYAVSLRNHELALRMALGAHRSRVLALVLRQGMMPVLTGITLGLLAAIVLGRLIGSLLFAVSPTDPATLTLVVAATLLAAFAAAIVPAQRAAGTSLLTALRHE